MKSFLNSSLLLVFLLLVGNLFFSSCDKDSNDPETAPVPLIASALSYNEDGHLYSGVSYQYDNQGRVIKSIKYDASYSTMEYSSSTIIVNNYEANELKSSNTAILDELGFCTSFSYEDIEHQESYEFDSNGYVKSAISEGNTWLIAFTYTVFEGNYVTIISEDKSKTPSSATLKEVDFFQSSFISKNLENRFAPKNKLKSTATGNTNKSEFQYYNDKLNTIGNENTGMSFSGKQNKNPIKKAIYSYSSSSGFVDYQTINYTYEYDNKGRITKQTSDDGKYTVYTYVD